MIFGTCEIKTGGKPECMPQADANRLWVFKSSWNTTFESSAFDDSMTFGDDADVDAEVDPEDEGFLGFSSVP